MYMPRNKTQKKYNKKRLKGMGSKFSVLNNILKDFIEV